MITVLILVGLVVDLGGTRTPRLGFHVSESLNPWLPSNILFIQYWKDPGAVQRAELVENVSADRFLGIMSVIVQASFSLQGMETVAMQALNQNSQPRAHDHGSAASETESPRRNIAKAVQRVFYRIVVFYVSPLPLSPTI